MAIYHLEAKVISRGNGRSACAAAAYMSCSTIFNDYDGIQHDYTRKKGLVWEKVFLPEYAPKSWSDRSVLWNAVEENEKTKDSRLARELVVALPVELKEEEWKKLLAEYINKNFVSDGMCADVSIHDTDGHNPHAHILLTVRPLEQDGTWQYKTKKEYLCVRNGEERGFTAEEWKVVEKEGWEKQYAYKPEKGKKNIYLAPSEAERRGLVRANKYPKSSRYGRQNPISERWNSEEQLVEWRASWADMTNHYLELSNVPERIDHRSNADRGLDEKPTIHEGVFARRMEQEGKVSVRCETNRQIRADNKIIQEMKADMKELTEKVQRSIPEIAQMLETLRDNLILIQYQFRFNMNQLAGIGGFQKEKKPLLEELKKVRAVMKDKVAERKKLQTEKNKVSIWDMKKQFQMNKKLTTMTEDIEELKSKKSQLMAKLQCADESAVKALETKAVNLEKTQCHLENRQETLSKQKSEYMKKYTETLASIEPEELADVETARRMMWYDGKLALIQKLRETYGEVFSRRQFDQIVEEVDEKLPVRRAPREQKSVHEKLREYKREPEQKKKQKKHEMEM